MIPYDIDLCFYQADPENPLPPVYHAASIRLFHFLRSSDQLAIVRNSEFQHTVSCYPAVQFTHCIRRLTALYIPPIQDSLTQTKIKHWTQLWSFQKKILKAKSGKNKLFSSNLTMPENNVQNYLQLKQKANKTRST